MENLSTLLVAFMFITILTLGIAGILTELAEIVRSARTTPTDGHLLGWMLLLLFAYFVMFWHTADIALVEEWDFWSFLFTETGPVLLLFATQVLLGTQASDGTEETQSFIRQGRFFILFGVVQLWSIGAGAVLGEGLGIFSGLDLATLLICLVLATTANRTVHTLGLVLVWAVYIGGALLETSA